MTTGAIPCGIAVGLAAAAAITDWRDGIIPNWLTIPPLVAAPVAYLALFGLHVALASLIGALVCGAGPYILFRRDAIGGGDVKLLAAVGAVAGVAVGLEGQLFGFVMAALWALVITAVRGGLFTMLANALFLAINPILPARWRREIVPQEMTSLRLGGFILAGLCLSITLRFAVAA